MAHRTPDNADVSEHEGAPFQGPLCFSSRIAGRLLDRLRDAATGTTNLVPIILEAVECYATLGEISDALREVFGEYREHVVL
ncbi:MAG: hypothetical protein HYZ81_06400 [Nitrospinae bacterium]|nr:hypothetical protein [Nitrospinota bacterium]